MKNDASENLKSLQKGCPHRKKGSEGYTVPTALVLMCLLFSFAMGLLMFAAYNFNNAYQRQEKLQTYLYAKNLLDECEYSIMNGQMNYFLMTVIGDVNQDLTGENENVYGKEYHVKLGLSDAELLKNSFNDEKISLEMFVTYKPNSSGLSLPDHTSQYLSIGDKLEIEFRIGKADAQRGKPMEYRIVSEFYCSYDANKNPDGSLKDVGDWETDTNMKWQPFQQRGKIYAE